MLFQSSTIVNGFQKVTNMSNTTLSKSALDEIAHEILENEEIDSVSVVCKYDGDETPGNESIFQVWHGENYILSVSNDGVSFSE